MKSVRVMSLKLETEGVMFNVGSGSASQVGCELEEKEKLWSEEDEVKRRISRDEVSREPPRTIMSADDFVICSESG